MKGKALVLAAMLSPAVAPACDIHDACSWAAHGAIAAAVVHVAPKEWRKPVAVAVCGAFLAWEAQQRGGAFNDLDSRMDWAIPCTVAAGVSVAPGGIFFWRRF